MGAHKTHGHTSVSAGRSSPEYRSWQSMKGRCLRFSEDHASYFGMPIYARWIDSFEAFLADMGPRPTPEHTLDRKDTGRGYSPDNCRWATKKEQASNRRNNVYAGRSMEDVGREVGLSRHTIAARIARGHSPDAALAPKGTSIRCGHNGDCARGEKNIHSKLTAEQVGTILRDRGRSTEIAAKYGVSKTTINLIRSRKIWSHINV